MGRVIGFDDLLSALRSALVNAQEGLNRRCGGPRYGADRTDKGRGHGCGAVAISIFSVEFGFRLEERTLKGVGRVCFMTLCGREKRGPGGRMRPRVVITMSGRDGFAGEVRINGELFAEVPPGRREGEPGGQAEVPKPFPLPTPRFPGSRGKLRSFVLTAGQEKRARAIIGCPTQEGAGPSKALEQGVQLFEGDRGGQG